MHILKLRQIQRLQQGVVGLIHDVALHLKLVNFLENLLGIILVHYHLLENLVLLLHLLLLLLLRLVKPLLLLLLRTMRVSVISSIVGILHSLLWLKVRRSKSLAHEFALIHLGGMRELLLVHLRIVVDLVSDLYDLDFIAAVILIILLLIKLRHLELIEHWLSLLLHL